jgi:hypothetical protein
VVDGWMNRFTRGFPSSVKVTASKGTSVVAVDYAIRIEHWNDFKNEILSEYPGFFRIRISKKVNDTSHHPAANDFAWMDSCCNNNALSLLKVLLIILASNN